MRRTLLSILALLLTIAAEAQTLKITTSSNTYSFSATEMTENSPATFSNGSTVTKTGETISSETTGISSLITPADDSSAVRYTLDGRRALSTHKGIIIQNGQKYVSK